MTQALVASQEFLAACPGAHAGALVLRGAANQATCPALEQARGEIEAELRGTYGGLDRAALKQLPTIAAYCAYYGRFGKSHHVLLQLESVEVSPAEAAR